MFKKIKRYLKDPYYALGNDMIKKCPRLMPDKFYLSVLWKGVMGYEIDWKDPKTFNEKLQWLKLYDRKPEYTRMVDKYRAKQWVADKIGEQYVIPTLAVYNSVDEIDLDKLPDQFVLKCNHDSGGVVICKDKASFDLEAAKSKLNKCLRHNFYWDTREWPYKNIERCVFAELFLDPSPNAHELFDYKFYCFNGEPKLFYITSDKGGYLPTKEDFFDLNGNHLGVQDKQFLNNTVKTPDLPTRLDDMVRICRILAKDKAHLRVDFYEICGRVYCGELTFYENGGFCVFEPEEWNRRMGDWIILPEVK